MSAPRRSVTCVTLAMAAMVGVVRSPEVRSAALGESVTLKIGEATKIESETLEIGFEDVPVDSRCPKGERCISEGDATVRVWLQKAGGARETRDLHASSSEGGAVSTMTYEVRLLRLDPYPVSGSAIARADYRATLEVTSGPSSSR